MPPMINLIAFSLGVIGAWLWSDGLYSIILYLNAPRFNGKKQSWKTDHWIRCVRMGLGLILIGLGLIMIIGFMGE